MAKVSLILPTFNERENIKRLLEAILSYLRPPREIIVVDDNSPDGTWEVVQRLECKCSSIRLIRRQGQRGLASALAEGIAAATGDIIGWMDADFSMPPEFLPILLVRLEECDLAFGSRYVAGGADKRGEWLRVVASRWLNGLASLLLGFPPRDHVSGFILARREVLEQVPLPSAVYGEYCIEFLHRARRKGFRLQEVGYVCSPRWRGRSKPGTNLLTLVKYGWVYLWNIIKLRGQFWVEDWRSGSPHKGGSFYA